MATSSFLAFVPPAPIHVDELRRGDRVTLNDGREAVLLDDGGSTERRVQITYGLPSPGFPADYSSVQTVPATLIGRAHLVRGEQTQRPVLTRHVRDDID